MLSFDIELNINMTRINKILNMRNIDYRKANF